MRHDTFTVGTTDYRREFWNKTMRGSEASYEKVKGGNVGNNMFVLPTDSNRKFMDALSREGFFRSHATCVDAPKSDSSIWASDSEASAEWVPEGGSIEIDDMASEFERFPVHCNKLAVITRIDNDFVHDMDFDIEKHLVKHFAKRFGKAEEEAFICGDGADKPIGILDDSQGASVGSMPETVTFDDVLELFRHLDAQYRRNAIWVMNDDTALYLRKLKDADGNYLWNHNNDTILGKPVFISEFMPDMESGMKPIAFGDFSYYWIVNRKPLSVRALQEKFALHDQTGYLAEEYLDGRLIRQDAIVTMKMK